MHNAFTDEKRLRGQPKMCIRDSYIAEPIMVTKDNYKNFKDEMFKLYTE